MHQLFSRGEDSVAGITQFWMALCGLGGLQGKKLSLRWWLSTNDLSPSTSKACPGYWETEGQRVQQERSLDLAPGFHCNMARSSFSSSFCFGIHQSQTQGMWWHSKSLWLIHAGPQALPLSATWWSSYHHLVFFHSQTALPRIPVITWTEIGLSVQVSLVLCYTDLSPPHPHWDSLA